MLIKLKTILVFASLLVAVPAYSAEWNYKKPSYDPTGTAQLKILDGALKNVSNIGQGGVQSSSSPTVLSVSVGGASGKELYNIAVTPAYGRYRAILSEPMVVGEYYEITSFYERTGGSGSNYGYYRCVPVRYGSRLIQYTGPGQTFRSSSVCSTSSQGEYVQTSNFTIVNSTTIDGYGSEWNEYYGYDNHNIATVYQSPAGRKEIYSLWQTPHSFRANLYEPLVVGGKYEISGQYHRTGGSSSGSYYKCVPVREGKRVIEYVGPGQTVVLQSTCMGGSVSHNTITSTFIIRDERTIDGSVSEWNEYYGYDQHNVVSVIVLPPP